ncbi:MAG: hypothetical protein IJK06_02315 [Clostridia bacterium]|nr:hypothetical protein [Clostridia bacterium]
MRTLSYIELPLTNDFRQVFTVDVTIDGDALHARVEIRYLSALDQWVISIWDNATSVLLANQVPLICSYGELNDLLLPFRYIRDGGGVGSLFVLRNTDEPSTVNPAKGNLTEFQVLFGDTFVPELEESA